MAADLEEDESFTPKRAGALIRSIGLKPRRTENGYTFTVDDTQLKNLVERYGVKAA